MDSNLLKSIPEIHNLFSRYGPTMEAAAIAFAVAIVFAVIYMVTSEKRPKTR